MKRLIIASVVIVSIAAVALWGNRLLERTLDARLAPLLSEQLGLPVQLSPLQTHLLPLKASSANLTMGDPSNPAVVATSVEVALAWPDLLLGEIRLVSASASDLMVRPSRWPASADPLPENYHFLDPYLPRTLVLDTGRYVDDGGTAYPVNQFQWQRHGSGRASAQWIDKRNSGDVSLEVQLTSLPALLQLAPVEAELTATVAGKPDATVSLQMQIQPATTSAYSMQLDLQAAGLTAHINTTGRTAWQLPSESTITIPLLEPTRISALLGIFGEDDQNIDLATQLAQTLPRLSLPAHQGHVVINEVRFDDEINKDTTFDVATGAQGLQISALTSQGPAGILTGDLSIASDAQGWTVAMAAQLRARDAAGGIAPQFVGSDWLLQTGRATLNGQGDTWDTLLNSMQGDAAAAGHYQGTVATPVTFEAQLDKHPGEFALERVSITLGKGALTGSIALSGTQQRKLSADLQGSNLDLGFLFATNGEQPLPGIPLPTYLGVLPELELHVSLDITGLETPALKVSHATTTLDRTAHGGKLVATAKGVHAGNLALTLEAITLANEPGTVQLSATFNDLDIPEMFRQRGLMYSRSSGSLDFSSKGDDMAEIFKALRGTAKLAIDVRADNDWQRTQVAEEKLEFTGNSHFVISDERILGLVIEKLNIDSIEQNLTGTVSLVAGRSPWLVADLESERINIESLLALLPESTDKNDSHVLSSLQSFGAAQASIAIKSLRLYEIPLSNVRINVTSSPNVLAVKQLDFSTQNGTLKSQAQLSWKGERATLESTAELSSVDLDQFLITSKELVHVPVSGSAKLNSEGSDVEELVRNVTGYVDLEADSPQQGVAPVARRKLQMKATRLADGMQADISSLQWGETDLTGTVRYQPSQPPSVDIEIHSGSLSLLPWEDAYLKEGDAAETRPDAQTVVSVAKTSADFVGNVLLTPFRWLADDTDPAPGAKLFNSDPLPLDDLKSFNLTLSAQLDALESNALSVKKLSVKGRLENGLLSVQANSDELSQGNGEVALNLDAGTSPPTLGITSTFNNVHGLTGQDTYPRSGFISLASNGQSEAELAANASGLVYLELGKGPFDYANSVLLTANLASTVFQTLIPGIDRKKPELQCGVAVALFQDGKGVTPYGFAARTNQANLLGHVQIDLANETLLMNLDSRGRKGAGLSVGSIFSNTVQIKGPLTDPGIVPDTVGLVWRGWAAVMTGGLSVLGESLFKRVLASENPCTSIKAMISKDLCPKNPIAASSPLVCPQT